MSLPRARGSPGKACERPECREQGGDLSAGSRPLQPAQTWPCPPDRSVAEALADAEGGVAAARGAQASFLLPKEGGLAPPLHIPPLSAQGL